MADAAAAVPADEPADAGVETLEDKLTRQLKELQAKVEAAQKELTPLTNELNIFSKKTTKAQRVLAVIWCAPALSGHLQDMQWSTTWHCVITRALHDMSSTSPCWPGGVYTSILTRCAVCSSKARNAYAKEQLAADFQEGIAEMHAQGQGATSAGTL